MTKQSLKNYNYQYFLKCIDSGSVLSYMLMWVARADKV